MRPSCKEIINQKNEWLFDFSKIKDLETVTLIIENPDEDINFEEFIKYFLCHKVKANPNEISIETSKVFHFFNFNLFYKYFYDNKVLNSRHNSPLLSKSENSE